MLCIGTARSEYELNLFDQALDLYKQLKNIQKNQMLKVFLG